MISSFPPHKRVNIFKHLYMHWYSTSGCNADGIHSAHKATESKQGGVYGYKLNHNITVIHGSDRRLFFS